MSKDEQELGVSNSEIKNHISFLVILEIGSSRFYFPTLVTMLVPGNIYFISGNT